MTSDPHVYVELNRRFITVARDRDGDLVEALNRFHWGAPAGEGWSELLLRPCVVVLGEAGTGKTFELREQAKHLIQQGKAAFFVPVEDVAARGLVAALDLDASERFEAWRAGSEEAWFLLDSVDEAKLKQHTVRSAVNGFAKALVPHLGRAHLLLSSRVSDWRSEDERQLAEIQRRLMQPEGKAASSKPEALHIVQLAPLDRAQTRKFAERVGVEEVDRFLDDIEKNHAWPFAERPQDVQWLASYWMKQRRLGSLTELVSFNIDAKLKDDKASMIAPDRAREGARMLAAAAALTQKTSFLLPGEPRGPYTSDALDPRDILPGWKDDEVHYLLRRPLFDEATYGRVRIHHRTALEFLAAEHLDLLVERGQPIADLEVLLFREVGHRTVVPPHLTAVLAWLAPKHRSLRTKAIRVAPEHLVDEADPAALTGEDRRAVLRAYAAKFRDRDHMYLQFDPTGLRRFAGPDVTDVVRDLLLDPGQPEHLKRTLLELVLHGEMSAAVDAALTLALADDSTPAVRSEAIEAVAKAGSPAEKTKLVGLLSQPSARKRTIAGRLLKALFPEHLSVEQLVAYLLTIEPTDGMRLVSLDVFVGSTLSSLCSPRERQQMVSLLLPALIDESKGRPSVGFVALRPEHVWLLELFVELVIAILLGSASSGAELPLEAVEVLFALDSHPDTHSAASRYYRAVAQNAALRRILLWRRVGIAKTRTGKWPRHPHEVNFWSLRLTRDDVSWLTEDCLARSVIQERLLAFDLLSQIINQTEEPAPAIAFLRSVASRDETQVLSRRLERGLNPALGMFWQEPYRLQRAAMNRRNERAHKESSRRLHEQIESIRSGENDQALYHLYEVGLLNDSQTEAASRIRSCLDAISSRYGDEIGSAARAGFKELWRKQCTVLPHEVEPNIIPDACCAGMLGVELDVADGLDFGMLSPELRHNAVVCACWDFNGWPDWLGRLTEANPAFIREVLQPSLELDYHRSHDSPHLGRILWRLPRAPLVARQACAPDLLRLVRVNDPPHVDTLTTLFEVFQGLDGDFSDELVALAKERTLQSVHEPARYTVWWCYWAAREPIEAVIALEGAAAHATDPAGLVEAVCAHFWNTRSSMSAVPQPIFSKSLDALRRFVPLAYKYVRPQDDLKHERAHFVERRDNAQELRNQALNWLTQIPEPEVLPALDALAEDPNLASVRDWIRFSADACAARCPPLSLKDALHFLRDLVYEPTTAAELFTVAKNRLDDIAHYLAKGDFTVRQAYNPTGPTDPPILEERAQNLLAHELDTRRRGQYTVVREAEVADKLRTDIRLLNPRCDGPVTIEIKIAERWKLDQLRDALKRQLVGTYMRAHDSRFGIFLVCSSGPPLHEVHGSKDGVPLDQVLATLRAEAELLRQSNSAIRGLEVVGIDFHPPPIPGKSVEARKSPDPTSPAKRKPRTPVTARPRKGKPRSAG